MSAIKKNASPWSKQLKKLPEWINMRSLSIVCGMEATYLTQVKMGRTKLDKQQAKRVIMELSKLEKAIGYEQGELFT